MLNSSEKFGKREWVLSGAVLFALLLVVFTASRDVSGNADYICTKVIEENGDCTNGAWGNWTPVSSESDMSACVLTTREQRVYTGTRAVRHTLQYASGRAACDASYTQQQVGNGWMENWSGFHGGTVTSESAACQVVETRNTRSPITTGVCAAREPIQTTVTTETQTIDGQVTTETQELGASSFGLALVDIDAIPKLLRPGDTTNVSWRTHNQVRNCAITVTRGGATLDTWSGIPGAGQRVSDSIPESTTFTISCTLSGTRPVGFENAPLTDSVTVGIIPQWQEN